MGLTTPQEGSVRAILPVLLYFEHADEGQEAFQRLAYEGEFYSKAF